MKLFKEVIRNNLKLMIIYVILGISFTFLGLYATNYFQVIIDAFGNKSITLGMIIILRDNSFNNSHFRIH